MAKNFYIELHQSNPAIVFASIQPSGFELITDQEKLLQLTKAQYNEREFAGKDFYNGFRSQLYLLVVGGSITPTQAFVVESYLSNLKDALCSGNWLTAQYVCSVTPLSGIFDATLKSNILGGISNYIANNY
jgi:hypothetical protein